MDLLAKLIVKNRGKIGIFFLVALIFNILIIPAVTINYNMAEYVPDDKPSKHALNVVKDEFGMQSIARIMINNVTLVEAKEYKDKIAKVPGVDMVMWLDDEVDVYQPESFIPKSTLDEYYKDGSALLEVMFEEDEYSSKTDKAIDAIKEIVPEGTNMIGSAIETKSSRDSLKTEIIMIMAILIPVVIIILLLTTTSWFSPIIFMLVIGTSILLNMGSNIIFKHVSFVTFSIVAALQLAVSMDYSVFMLHKFEEEHEKIEDPEEAMIETIKKSIVSVLSSALTTIAGFLALAFMEFGIGKDMGLVFAKGIVLSLFTVILLMPYLILKFYPKIQKTTHKSLLPSFEKFGRATKILAKPVLVIVLLITIPSYVGQKYNKFFYGSAAFGGGKGTVVYNDEQEIIKKFGRSELLVLLVPNDGNYVKQKNMVTELENLTVMKKVQTLVNNVPEGVPDSFVPKNLYDKFKNENYVRALLSIKTAPESELAFDSKTKIDEIVSKYYGDDFELTGVVPITMDIKTVVEADYRTVNLLSILAVMVIILVAFKSIALPVILISVIEAGIFINMATPYFTGGSLIFVGYLIVSTIQLGATIDYAILMTNNYLDSRKTMNRVDSSINAVKLSIPSILTSGGILVAAAYILRYISTIKAVSEIGALIGRGALMSIILVSIFLPQLLRFLDKIVEKTMIGHDEFSKE